MRNDKEVALRKRQQIDASKRTMFMAVALAAFVSGIALVVSFFLVQQIIFHGKIIATKQDTIGTIKDNAKAIEQLKDDIRVLDTNTALNSVKVNQENSALQVILDALPAEPNADALGASLQFKIAQPVDGITIEALSVVPTDADTTVAPVIAEEESNNESEYPSIRFNMVVSGSAASLQSLLSRFEKSIRVIELTSVEVQAGSSGNRMSMMGRAYYEPARDIQIGKKVVKP